MNRARPMAARLKNKPRVDYEPRSAHGRAVNEFNLNVNEISFSYERMSTKTRFEKEAKGNSEMAY